MAREVKRWEDMKQPQNATFNSFMKQRQKQKSDQIKISQPKNRKWPLKSDQNQTKPSSTYLANQNT